jgi:hypothetical protein
MAFFILVTSLYLRKSCEQKSTSRSPEKAQPNLKSSKILNDDTSGSPCNKSSHSSLTSKNSTRCIRSIARKPICTIRGTVAEGVESVLYKRKFEALSSSTSHHLQTRSTSAGQDGPATKECDIRQLVSSFLKFSRYEFRPVDNIRQTSA